MISIAMATYNGEKHLREQLASIASQTYLPLELVVCDDGSTDETLSILHEFSTVAPFECRIFRNEKTLGFAENFLRSASHCKGNWIAFCDQDDVWLPTKLEDAYKEIINNSGLYLVLQNAYICDDALNKHKPFKGVFYVKIYEIAWCNRDCRLRRTFHVFRKRLVGPLG